MKKILTLTILLLLASCDNNTKLEKPFTIIDKKTTSHYGDYSCFYTYQDKNGLKVTFKDEAYKFKIGDTIK